jgi:hypothetical protein
MRNIVVIGLLAAMIASPASAAIIISQGASAPTYSTTLTFDEPGTPTGVVPQTTWLGSHGVVIDAGDGVPYVDDFTGTYPWVGTGNSFFGNFGVFMDFTQGLTAMSIQCWDPSGPPSPFGGGLAIYVLDENDNILAANAFTPAWGGLGLPWFNITTTAGETFYDVRLLGNGFSQATFVDNASWNVVPEPATLSLLMLGALAGLRRRR